jgi:hypothetical protein
MYNTVMADIDYSASFNKRLKSRKYTIYFVIACIAISFVGMMLQYEKFSAALLFLAAGASGYNWLKNRKGYRDDIKTGRLPGNNWFHPRERSVYSDKDYSWTTSLIVLGILFLGFLLPIVYVLFWRG